MWVCVGGNELKHIHYRCKSTKNKYNFSSFDAKFFMRRDSLSYIVGIARCFALELDTNEECRLVPDEHVIKCQTLFCI